MKKTFIERLHQFFFKHNPYLVFGAITFLLGYMYISKEFMVIPLILMAIGAINFAVGCEYGYWIDQITAGRKKGELKGWYGGR